MQIVANSGFCRGLEAVETSTVEAVPFHRPYYGAGAASALAEALASRSLDGGGTTVREQEARIADMLGAPHVLLTPSCTSALEIACTVAGFSSGDEVIVPAFTFVSSASAISATGARPVFVDVLPDNLCLDLDGVTRALSARTKGIVAVHYAGQACDLRRLMALAQEHDLVVIEDAAQGFLCSQAGYWLGRVGHLGCFSFHDSKVFSSGEGGALVVNDTRFSETAIQVREKGTNRRSFLRGEVDRYGWVRQGTSGMMGGTAAALLGAQLEERDAIVANRMSIFERYDRELRPIFLSRGWRTIRQRDDEKLTAHIWWAISRHEEERVRFASFLRARGIATATHYPSLHRSVYAHTMGIAPNHPLPATEHAAIALLRLPLYTNMPQREVDTVIEATRAFLSRE